MERQGGVQKFSCRTWVFSEPIRTLDPFCFPPTRPLAGPQPGAGDTRRRRSAAVQELDFMQFTKYYFYE